MRTYTRNIDDSYSIPLAHKRGVSGNDLPKSHVIDAGDHFRMTLEEFVEGVDGYDTYMDSDKSKPIFLTVDDEEVAVVMPVSYTEGRGSFGFSRDTTYAESLTALFSAMAKGQDLLLRRVSREPFAVLLPYYKENALA